MQFRDVGKHVTIADHIVQMCGASPIFPWFKVFTITGHRTFLLPAYACWPLSHALIWFLSEKHNNMTVPYFSPLNA